MLTQDRCTVCVLEAQKSLCTHRMELIDDVGHVESCFGPFGDSASVGATEVHGLCQTYLRLRNHFWMHPVVLLGEKAPVDA
jgi:hypothetical protein